MLAIARTLASERREGSITSAAPPVAIRLGNASFVAVFIASACRERFILEVKSIEFLTTKVFNVTRGSNFACPVLTACYYNRHSAANAILSVR